MVNTLERYEHQFTSKNSDFLRKHVRIFLSDRWVFNVAESRWGSSIVVRRSLCAGWVGEKEKREA